MEKNGAFALTLGGESVAVREPELQRRVQARQIHWILRERIDRPSNVALDGLSRLTEERVRHALAARHAVAFA